MVFVNEIVSEEDIQKNNLDALLAEFQAYSWREGRPSTFTHAWTIDRERNIYFLPVKSVEETGQSGRLQPTRGKICILNWENSRIQLLISRDANSSVDYKAPIFRIIWDLLELDASAAPNLPRREIVKVLKEALTVFGDDGAHLQVPNTLVEFKF
ncbi:MAG TPA: hypothetical protein PLD78_15995 [Burkholderiaceae bacterium]|nr:hypothetical protein [Burkholderiaceae bacterium]